MKKLVFDIEANGFLHDADVIWCIAIQDPDDPRVVQNYSNHSDDDRYIQEAVDILNDADVLIGHNIAGFDIPLIEKLYPGRLKLKGKEIFDTFLGSCLVYPDRRGHSLEAWAEWLSLSVKKIEWDDWSKYDHMMITRCETDVRINTSVYHHLVNTWLPSKPNVLRIESRVGRIHAAQEDHGVYYDTGTAHSLLSTWGETLKNLEKEIASGVPPKLKSGAVVHNPYKKDGSLSARAEKYLEDHVSFTETKTPVVTRHVHVPPRRVGPFTVLNWIPFNIDSSMQVSEFLLSQGWKPTQWNFVRDKDTGKMVKSSPKLTEDSYGSLPAGLGKKIADYKTLIHRYRMVRNALDAVRYDNRVPAEALTCATPTSRYRHMKAVCNIPRPSSPYGNDVRGLFSVAPGHTMLGVDLSGIEARMMAHYAYPFPGGHELADLVLKGNFHKHNASLWDCSYDDAKTGLYALMYGCGEAKLASSLGKPKGSGGKWFKKFWDGAPALKALIDELDAAMASGRDIHGLDGRVLSIRERRKGLNTLLQGGAAVVFKVWMCLIDKWITEEGYSHKVHQVIAYHDELQFEIASGEEFARLVGEKFVELAGVAGELLKVRVPITGEAKVGKNWAETH
jgi:DNA polymerase I-like protein with 3'-5' exonuclease and polymerase domains